MSKKTSIIITLCITLLSSYPTLAAQKRAYHESPSSGSIESGIGIIRGWACDAQKINALIDKGININLAYGTSRGDTKAVCGDNNNGYGATYNWNLLADGQHRMRTYVDDILISDFYFQVTAMPDEFLVGAHHEFSLHNFPNTGDYLNLTWSQAHQNFVFSNYQDATQAAHPIIETQLTIDLAQLTGHAEYLLSPEGSTSLTLEAAGLTILDAFLDDTPISYNLNNGLLQFVLPSARERLVINYKFDLTAPFEGLFSSDAASYTWPYFCQNLFPCISDPAQGMRYQLQLTGLKNGETAIYPPQITNKVPAYQLAWATGQYTYLQLGITDANTRVGVWTLPNHRAAARIGTEKLTIMFDWLEKKLGAYPFGSDVASIDVDWPNTVGGGMEHHPYWHIETAELNNPEVHIHEAAHGWFGNGIRLACWEDFVLSEGLASYLAAAAIGEAYGPSEEAAVWQSYQQRLQAAIQTNNHIAWPTGCGEVDVLELFTDIPYMKGAFFFRDLEQITGRNRLLSSLGGFYRQYHGKAATFDQLLESIQSQTQYNPHPLAESWLRSLTLP